MLLETWLQICVACAFRSAIDSIDFFIWIKSTTKMPINFVHWFIARDPEVVEEIWLQTCVSMPQGMSWATLDLLFELI